MEALNIRLDTRFCPNAIEALEDKTTRQRLRDVRQAVEALFRGDLVNWSENRPALHVALRWPSVSEPPPFGGEILEAVLHERERMLAFAQEVRAQRLKGVTGKAIDTVVNIGVGGSDLGPRLLVDAFEERMQTPVHFVATMDGVELERVLRRIEPERTLFIVASKSFTTTDTLLNAETALEYIASSLEVTKADVLNRHFAGVSANPEKMTSWGIPRERQFRIWDWVGGRYSVWGSMGLAAAIGIGTEAYLEFLQGGHEMDRHLYDTPMIDETLPGLLGWISYYHAVEKNIRTHAILPYDARLALLPRYLTQLEMESNGKSLTKGKRLLTIPSGPTIVGDVGTLAQHAFLQQFHQGTDPCSTEIIYFKRNPQLTLFNATRLKQHHMHTQANALAQAQALWDGTVDTSSEENAGWGYCSGGRPSTLIEIDELSPYSLGSLLALYEHKVFTFASLLNTNPFDQWGVELGKSLAYSRVEGVD